jgi:holo-[acyl-carrier protein] synthase
MIVGTGVDVIEPSRMREMIERHGDRFLERIFTEGEVAYCKPRKRAAEHFAVRFAAKEAVGKALGTGIGSGVSWKDIDVVKEPSGKPTLVLTGGAARVAATLGVTRTHVTLSHCEHSAIAVVVLEQE